MYIYRQYEAVTNRKNINQANLYTLDGLLGIQCFCCTFKHQHKWQQNQNVSGFLPFIHVLYQSNIQNSELTGSSACCWSSAALQHVTSALDQPEKLAHGSVITPCEAVTG